MARTRTLRVLSLLLGLALVAAACSSNSGGGTPGGNGTRGTSGGMPIKGGTLRIASEGDIDYFDPQQSYYSFTAQFFRGTLRELYSFDMTKAGTAQAADPVPDLATALPVISEGGKVYSIKLRGDVKWAPPVNRTVTAQDFVNAVERAYDKITPGPAQQYQNLIKGAEAFGAGKARSISGIQVVSPTELKITLDRPAGDFLSILAMPFFAPVPKEITSKYPVGSVAFSQHSPSNGPYMVSRYTASKELDLVRNPSWNPATDPLRKAYVDKITMQEGLDQATVQQKIEAGDADIGGDVPPPTADLRRLSGPQFKDQFFDGYIGCIQYLALGMGKGAGPTEKLQVRQAINYAIDKDAFRRALGGPFLGDYATTVLTPNVTVGYQPYDLYATPGHRGDPAKAKQLLAQAGYPNGVSLTYVGKNSPDARAGFTALQSSLAKAGITLKPQLLTSAERYKLLEVPAKRAQHQIGSASWCPDWPGDSARSFIAVLMDGRNIQPTGNQNYAEYNNPVVNSLIDQAETELDKAKRADLWHQADMQVMKDAAWAPLLYLKQPYFWSKRVKQWTWTPWTNQPDITYLYLNPNTP